MKFNEHLETLCVHAGVEPDPVTGAIMTPIYQTSTYIQQAPGQYKLYDYSRAGNPTRTALEVSMATLEGAKEAITFASGMAAEQAIIQTLNSGDHVIVSEDVYGGTGRLFRMLFAKFGIEFEFLDLRDVDLVRSRLRPNTRMIWIESPTNPLLRIVDIPAMAEMAKAQGTLVVVDNTFCSPILQQPLSLGADIVLHSSTKYLGGHSDLIGGVVMTSHPEMAEKIRFVQFAAGAVNAPHECFLLLRSIKTLAIRMEKHCANAMAFAHALEAMDGVAQVIYPGLKSHPQHELASRQMSGFSGMVSAYIPGDLASIGQFLGRLKVFTLAESLGGVESLVNHPESMTHASVPPDLRAKLGINVSLVRFSLGIESAADLIEDVRQAMCG